MKVTMQKLKTKYQLHLRYRISWRWRSYPGL